MSASTYPPTQWSQLAINPSGGSPTTSIVGPFGIDSQPVVPLVAGETAMSRVGCYQIQINQYSPNNNLNWISQDFTLLPAAGSCPSRINFYVLPVLELPSTGPSHVGQEKPYFAVALFDNSAGGTQVFFDSIDPGVPGGTGYPFSASTGCIDPATACQPSGNYPCGGCCQNPICYQNGEDWVYTPWLYYDVQIPLTIGHDYEIRFLSSACSLGFHMGMAVVDGVGQNPVDLYVVTRPPISVGVDGTFSISYYYTQSTGFTATGVTLTMSIPTPFNVNGAGPVTISNVVPAPGWICTTSSSGTQCTIGSLTSGSTGVIIVVYTNTAPLGSSLFSYACINASGGSLIFAQNLCSPVLPKIQVE